MTKTDTRDGNHGALPRQAARSATVEVRRALSKVLANNRISRSRSLVRFLQFSVDQTLAGKADEIKEYTIGVDVFDRGAHFDPRVDPIVRVQARKLRRRLQDYYLTEGSEDPIRILFPKGAYVPEIVWREDARGTTRAAPERIQPFHSAEQSIVVLPFTSLYEESGNEYFSDGLSGELINILGQAPEFRVVARASAFAFKDKQIDVNEIGRRLRANYVLEGTVQRRQDAVRVTARLNDVASGYQMWSRRFDGAMDDIFLLQDEIAGEIAATVQSSLKKPERRPRGFVRQNVNGYREYLRAWHFWNRNTPDSLREALRIFEQAASHDPANARAQAGLATACAALATFGLLPTGIAREKAISATERAVEDAPELAEAWQAFGTVHSMLQWDWDGGAFGYERAISLNPNYAVAHHGYAVNCLMPLGEFEEGLAAMRRAVDLDPLSLFAGCDLATFLNFAGHCGEAVDQYRAVLELDPSCERARFEVIYPLIAGGNAQEALEVIESQSAVAISLPHVRLARALCLTLAGQTEQGESVLEQYLATCPKSEYSLCHLATVLDGLGRREEALAMFEESYAARDPSLRFLNVEPLAVPVRNEPRIQAIIHKMGLK